MKGVDFMARTFFKMLVDVETLVAKKSSDITQETKAVVSSVVSFVENGAYTDSDVEKFIVANFRLGATEMTKKWNETHLGKTKRVNTFCGQMSLLSSYISSIFQTSPDEFFDAIVNNDFEILNRIYSIVSLYNISNVDVSERFRALKSFLPDCSETKSFKLSECQKEFEILKTFDDAVISKMLEGVDFDKLIFLLNLCKKPLISNEYIELVDKKKKVKVARVDEDKLDFCRVLKSTKPIKLKPEKELIVSEPVQESVPIEELKTDSVAVEPKIVEVQEQIPYKLDINKGMADVISEYLEGYRKYALSHKGADKYLISADEGTAKKAELFLKCLTIEGTKARLSQLNPYSLDEAVKQGYLKENN